MGIPVPETGSLMTASSSRESAANLTSEGIAGQHNALIAAPYHTAWKLCAKLRRAMVKHRGREAGRVCAEAAKGRGERRRGHGAQAIRTPAFADLWRSSQVMAGAVLT